MLLVKCFTACQTTKALIKQRRRRDASPARDASQRQRLPTVTRRRDARDPARQADAQSRSNGERRSAPDPVSAGEDHKRTRAHDHGDRAISKLLREISAFEVLCVQHAKLTARHASPCECINPASAPSPNDHASRNEGSQHRRDGVGRTVPRPRDRDGRHTEKSVIGHKLV